MLSDPLTALWRISSILGPGGRDREPLPYRAWKWLWQQASRHRWRSDLFDRIAGTDWDLLVILDACRYDTLAAVTDTAVIEAARSPASATGPFLEQARERSLFSDTVYVSANPQSGNHSPGANLTHDPVYDDEWDDRLATVPPEPVYEAARTHLAKNRRVVAHTMQPHYPHICEIGGQTLPIPNGLHPRSFDGKQLREQKLQSLLANGFVDLDRARRSYRISVRFAWTKASEFAAELAASGYRVAITADHGELFGEYGFVEHPVDVNVGSLVTVPWVVFEPWSAGENHEAVTDRLAALGYAEQ